MPAVTPSPVRFPGTAMCLSALLSLVPALANAQMQGAALTDASPVVVTGTDEGAGLARLFNSTGTRIADAAPFGSLTGGVRVAIGDVNADGIPDFLLGTGPGSGVVRVFSGADYAPLFAASPFGASFSGGVYVAAGDIDADGYADIITGAGAGSGLVRIYSGVDGHEIVAAPPFSGGYIGGVTVAAGDLNGDGRTDVITGMAVGGLVRIFDGASLDIMAAGFPYGSLFFGGVNVAAGDVNGDGRDEAIVAPRTGGNLVHIVSLSAGVLASVAPFPDANGTSVAAGDVDGDGAADLVVGAGRGGVPQVRVFSYALQTQLAAMLAADPGFRGGVFVAASQGLSTVRFFSATSATFTTGVAQDFTVRSTGGATVTLSVEGALPAGLGFTDNGDGTGTLGGVAADDTGGLYPIRVVARRGAVEVGRQTFTLSVHGPIAITSAASATWQLNQPSTFTFTTTGFSAPTLTSTGGWPAGVTFVDEGDGTALLSGTATEAGTFSSTITASDSAGSTATQTFTLTVMSVNQPPSFTIGPNQTVDEDAGAQTVPNWATGISPGPGETSQTVTFLVTGNTNPSLFAAGPAVSPNGELTYTAAVNASGSAMVTLVLQDNGGTANGGVDVSPAQDFTITVNAVNDAPVVTSSGAMPTYTEGDLPIAVDAGITVTDVDDTTIESATVQITVNFQSGFDELLFADQNGITGSWSAATGTYALTGTATVANYVTALQSVTFRNTSNNPTQALRTIAWRVHDGTDASATAVSIIAVVAVNSPPTVVDEAFETLANTELRVDMTAVTTAHTSETTTGPSALEGVLDNDGDPEGDPIAVTGIEGCAVPDTTAPFDCTLSDGAVVHVEAGGNFSYTPAPGATSGSFTYTVTDTPSQGVPSSVNGTVTFTSFDMIWYVDGDATPGGNGTSIAPFSDFSSLNGAAGAGDTDGTGDYIFVHDSTVSGGIELEASQRLIGEGVGLVIDRGLNGNGAPTVVVAPGVRPLIENTFGDAVTVTTALAAEVVGLSLAGSPNAIDVTTAGALPDGATLTIANNEIVSASAEGIDVTIDVGTSGTLALNLLSNEWNTSNAHGGPAAVDVNQIAGALILDFSNNTNLTSALRAVSIVGGPNTVITGFANNSVHGSTAGSGVRVAGATFDSDIGTPGFQQVNGGSWTIGSSGDPVGTTGVDMSPVQGSLLFTDLDVAASFRGLFLNGAAAGMTFAVTPPSSGGSSTVVAQAGAAVDVSNTTLDLRLASLTSTTPAAGVSLTSVTGQFSAGPGSSITKSSGAGTAFVVSSSNAMITYSGALNVTSGAGVSLTSDTGATITFNGGMSLSTGVNAGFTAIGGGTINVCALSNCSSGGAVINTIATTTGTALNVANTTIGASNLIFQSISSDGGTAPGIVLDNTGTLGGLTVTGTGGVATGGTIQNKTVDGVWLNNTRDVSLSSMLIADNQGSGIFGDDVTNFSLVGSSVIDNADTATGAEANLRFIELLGNSAIANSTISGSSEDEIRITPSSGVLATLAVSDSQIGPNATATGGHGIAWIATGTAQGTIAISNTTFSTIRSTGSHINVSDTAVGTLNVSTSSFVSNGAAVTMESSLSADLNFNILDNTPIVGSVANAIQLVAASTSTNDSLIRGTISGNVIGDGTADSGSHDMSGIALELRGDQDAVIAMTNNSVRNTDLEGIRVSSADFGTIVGPGAQLDVTLRDNAVGPPDDNSPSPIGLIRGTLVDGQHTTSVCLDIAGNSSAGIGGGEHFRVRQRDLAIFRIERLSDGDAVPNELLTDAALVESHVAADNDPGSTVDALFDTGFTEATNGVCRKP